MHKLQLPVLFTLVLLSAGYAYPARAQPCSIGAEFRPSDFGRDRILVNFHCDALGMKPDDIHVQATVEHELIHALKTQGIIEDDVPYAAAVGYYVEWVLRGTLLDNTKVPIFQKGAKNVSAANIDALAQKYRPRTEPEPLESYEDGALLAGMMFGLFGKKADDARMYVLALASGVDHEFAVRTTEVQGLAKILLSLRLGHYFKFDNERLHHDLRKLDPQSRLNVERYLEAVNERLKISWVRRRDVVIGPFQLTK